MCILNFPQCHIFGQKVAMTCGSDPCISNKKIISKIHNFIMSPCTLMELLYHFSNKSTQQTLTAMSKSHTICQTADYLMNNEWVRL